MSRCPLCDSPEGHACSVVPALPLMVDHLGLGVRVTVKPLPRPERPEGERVRRKGHREGKVPAGPIGSYGHLAGRS